MGLNAQKAGLAKLGLIVALPSVTVFSSFVGANAGLWSFSLHLLIPSFVAWVFGVGFASYVGRRGGSLPAATVAAIAGVLLLVGGGPLSALIGPWALPAVPFLTVLVYYVLRRVFSDSALDHVQAGVVLALILVNGYSLLQAFQRAPDASSGPLRPTPVVASAKPDIFVLILDEFSSLDRAPLASDAMTQVDLLSDRGYEIYPTLWSSYTVSAAAVASVLVGDYPLLHREVLDDAAFSRLGKMTRGDNRLVHTLRSAGYDFTMVESGLWMTACGPLVDECIDRAPLDEALGVLLERSAARWWYQRIWGHAFTVSGLHAMERTRSAFVASTSNDRPDLVIAHVILPHIPYLLDSDCELHGENHESYGTRSQRLGGYQRQAACVVEWLVGTLDEVDEASTDYPAVIVTGDHGTNFRGQLSRPITEWTTEEISERLGAFALARFPTGCPSRDVQAISQLVDRLLACLTDEESSLPARHFLLSYGDDPVRAVEYPHTRLDVTASAPAPP